MKRNDKPYIPMVRPFMWGLMSSAAALISLYWLHYACIGFVRLEFLLSTIITCATTFSGFIIASVTILVSATSSDIMSTIRKQGASNELRWRYIESVFIGFIVIAWFSFIGATAIPDENMNYLSRGLATISAGVLGAYGYSLLTTCGYLMWIIGMLNEPSPSPDGQSVPKGEPRIGNK